eukprot:267387-Amorphochlora_amoeboformis.AAC.2
MRWTVVDWRGMSGIGRDLDVAIEGNLQNRRRFSNKQDNRGTGQIRRADSEVLFGCDFGVYIQS